MVAATSSRGGMLPSVVAVDFWTLAPSRSWRHRLDVGLSRLDTDSGVLTSVMAAAAINGGGTGASHGGTLPSIMAAPPGADLFV
jgi:hypothetical protein